MKTLRPVEDNHKISLAEKICRIAFFILKMNDKHNTFLTFITKLNQYCFNAPLLEGEPDRMRVLCVRSSVIVLHCIFHIRALVFLNS